MSPIQTVQEIYAAFGRGDIPAIVARLAPDVEWEYGANGHPAPWLQTIRGRDQVPRFFEALGAIELTQFQPKQILGDGNTVVVLLDEAFTARATGRQVVEEDAVHIWHFDDSGRVSRMRHRVDTLAHARAIDSV